jgi:hypothetical protein
MCLTISSVDTFRYSTFERSLCTHVKGRCRPYNVQYAGIVKITDIFGSINFFFSIQFNGCCYFSERLSRQDPGSKVAPATILGTCICRTTKIGIDSILARTRPRAQAPPRVALATSPDRAAVRAAARVTAAARAARRHAARPRDARGVRVPRRPRPQGGVQDRPARRGGARVRRRTMDAERRRHGRGGLRAALARGEQQRCAPRLPATSSHAPSRAEIRIDSRGGARIRES